MINSTGGNLTEFERAILSEITTKQAANYRTHLDHLRVKRRKATGVGVFVEFADYPAELGKSASERLGCGLDADIPGLEHGAGFVLYIDDGRITKLEMFSYDEGWPDEISEFKLEWHRVFCYPGRADE